MVKIKDIMNPDLLHRMVEEGYVRYQTHPTLPLGIWNYSEKAQFDKKWNEATLACRGLITTAVEISDFDVHVGDAEVIARPWRKFFNYGEGRLRIDDTMPVEVTDKMDGSLGILYPRSTELSIKMSCFGPNAGRTETVEPDDWAIATRGSFASEQAVHATKVWKDRYDDEIYVNPDYTFLFEIIYPENRIVCNYGDMDDLVLLGAVHIERGYYLGPNEAAGILRWPGPVTQVFPYRNIAEAFAADPRPNAEGFVVRSGTEIVKIKQVDYIELHRIVTNLTPLSLWRRLSARETLESLAEYIPDEWHEWLRTEYSKLMDAYNDVEQRVIESMEKVQIEMMEEVGRSLFSEEVILNDRKIWARHIKKSADNKYLFLMLDRKPIDQLIWTEIRPKGGEVVD